MRSRKDYVIVKAYNANRMTKRLQAEIGVFGGSGFYSLIEGAHEAWLDTPYGVPSDRVALGEMAGKKVAFLPRHGMDHRYAPHTINYRANLWVMKELGVKWIIGPTRPVRSQGSIVPAPWQSAISSSTARAAARTPFTTDPLRRTSASPTHTVRRCVPSQSKRCSRSTSRRTSAERWW